MCTDGCVYCVSCVSEIVGVYVLCKLCTDSMDVCIVLFVPQIVSGVCILSVVHI